MNVGGWVCDLFSATASLFADFVKELRLDPFAAVGFGTATGAVDFVPAGFAEGGDEGAVVFDVRVDVLGVDVGLAAGDGHALVLLVRCQSRRRVVGNGVGDVDGRTLDGVFDRGLESINQAVFTIGAAAVDFDDGRFGHIFETAYAFFPLMASAASALYTVTFELNERLCTYVDTGALALTRAVFEDLGAI